METAGMRIGRNRLCGKRLYVGSALILAVVLTSLLAIVGALFVMASRLDKIASAAVTDDRELDLAVDAVIAQIAQELALDVPGDPNSVQEYYDYPDEENTYLASQEPYYDVSMDKYFWRQMSDVYDNIPSQFVHTQEPIAIPEYQNPTAVGDSSSGPGSYAADADGDGVLDSVWIELPDITSSKGWPIYLAVRVIDNSGMANVNTVFADPGGDDQRKGDMLTDIYIDGLVKWREDPLDLQTRIFNFLTNRSDVVDAATYYAEAVRRIENPDTTAHFYTFYDISEELSLRNRFALYPERTVTRLEAGSVGDPNRCLSTTLRATNYGNASMPYTNTDFDAWKRRFNPFDVGYYGNEPNGNNYDFRHLLTTYNWDRIISPDGRKMGNVNADVGLDSIYLDELLERVTAAIIAANPGYNYYEASAAAAQITANLIDFRDDDDIVTAVVDVNGYTYYGFERPCVYISELVFSSPAGGRDIRSYAIELHKPYEEDSKPDPGLWRLVIDNSVVGVNDVNDSIDWSGTSDFHVILFEDPNAPLRALVDFNDVNDPNDPNDPNGPEFQSGFGGWLPGQIVFDVGSIISLQRFVPDTGVYITVDSVEVPDWLITGIHPNLPPAIETRSFQRDISLHRPIRRLWDDSCTAACAVSPTMGYYNLFEDHGYPNTVIQAHPDNVDFVGIADIGKVFAVDAYRIGPLDLEEDVRINLVDPFFQQMFSYLTVFDPTGDYIDNDGDDLGIDTNGDTILDANEIDADEIKVPGRININTAPWFVIAQLPWMTPGIAQAVTFYRDSPSGPFASIGQLSDINDVAPFPPFNFVGPDFSIHQYARKDGYSGDQLGFPDLTPEDGAEDDLEERDLIFARISNLVTVRSDVFTAYILVRLGTDGPQKRVVAVLDRSNVNYDPEKGQMIGKVNVVALHAVPDPR